MKQNLKFNTGQHTKDTESYLFGPDIQGSTSERFNSIYDEYTLSC